MIVSQDGTLAKPETCRSTRHQTLKSHPKEQQGMRRSRQSIITNPKRKIFPLENLLKMVKWLSVILIFSKKKILILLKISITLKKLISVITWIWLLVNNCSKLYNGLSYKNFGNSWASRNKSHNCLKIGRGFGFFHTHMKKSFSTVLRTVLGSSVCWSFSNTWLEKKLQLFNL